MNELYFDFESLVNNASLSVRESSQMITITLIFDVQVNVIHLIQ